MATYWCVESVFRDNGKSTVGIISHMEAEEKPESSFHSGPRADVYFDWFDSYEEAENFVKEAV